MTQKQTQDFYTRLNLAVKARGEKLGYILEKVDMRNSSFYENKKNDRVLRGDVIARLAWHLQIPVSYLLLGNMPLDTALSRGRDENT